jgi:transposase-like protein
MGFGHKRVNHAAKVYVEGDAHTNTLEGFWSLLKRGIDGVYHSVSTKHLQSYVSEYAWRYNHRNDLKSSFRTLLLRAAQPQ